MAAAHSTSSNAAVLTELQDLVDDFKLKLEDVRSSMEPIVRRVEGNEMPTEKGVSYLEVKHQLLLSYCMNMVFYLLMKVEGKSVRDHPVLHQLVEIRTTLERLRPLDGKLKYQIDKLLKLQGEGAATADGIEDDEDESLNFKPNPQNMLTKGSDSSGQSSDVYQPPKLSATPFEEYERAATKRNKEGKKRQKKLLKSELLREIRGEFGDAPEEISHREGFDDKTNKQEDEERRDYEEDRFVRTTMSKKDKKKRKERERNANGIDSVLGMDNFGDLEDTINDSRGGEDFGNKRQKKKGRR
jgi:hypothetical protein